MLDQFKNLCGVTVFVVIECDQLEELVVKLYTFSRIEYRSVRISDEIARNDLIIDILDNALHSAFRCFLHLSADLFVAC